MVTTRNYNFIEIFRQQALQGRTFLESLQSFVKLEISLLTKIY